MILKEHYGITKDGKDVECYTLKNSNNLSVSIINYGGIVTSCRVPDRHGNMIDIVLGYDNISDYEKQDTYFGAIIGRHANRIENAAFNLFGKEYILYKNDGNNSLHGGKEGFDKKIWKASAEEDGLHLSYISPNKEEGFPGTLSVGVVYSLDDENNFKIEYNAETDKDTVCNLTNHSYFNLNGHNSGTVEKQKAQIISGYFTPADKGLIPDGTIVKVDNTPMDFRVLKPIGEDINSDYSQIKYAGGFDSNWVLDCWDGTLQKCAFAASDESGVTLTVYTTLPGIQFYSGNFINIQKPCKDNAVYVKRSGFCLETQYFPNSLSHKHFPQPVLKSGDIFKHTTIYRFGVLK